MINQEMVSRIKVQQVIEDQLPEFILDESPKYVEFIKQYYISQEYQSGPIDIVENLDQYLKLDNLLPEVIDGSTILEDDISEISDTIMVSSTKGYPSKYGLLKINDEIITYTGITTNTFTGCVRGFSAITNYHDELNQEELIFSSTNSSPHSSGSKVENLSSLFLKDFYKKLKYTFTPGLENLDFAKDLNVGNFIKEAISLYTSKGTEESYKILFKALYGVNPRIINLEEFLLKSSSSNYIRREVIVAKEITGDPSRLVGQTIFKTTNTNSSASVSEVEIIGRNGVNYYKISLFIGYDDVSSAITGTFDITGSSRVLDKVSIGASIITVDSTIGFPDSGLIYTENGNEISYTSKSINQFFNCSGVKEIIEKTKIIRSNETYFGYEDGNTNKKVELRITGVISKFQTNLNPFAFNVREKIKVGYLGDKIDNSEKNRSKKQIFANSLIYNTSSRYKIKNVIGNGNQVEVFSEVDRSSLKVNDKIEVLYQDSEVLAVDDALVTNISDKIISLDKDLSSLIGKLDLRRKLNKASSSIVPIEFGNNNVISDVQNLYSENDEFLYVAFNSLPSYTIDRNILKYTASGIDGFNPETEKYSILKFEDEISFITGDEIFYQNILDSSTDLKTDIYYVKVFENKKEISLYKSRSFIESNNFSVFSNIPSGYFVLTKQKSDKISPQKNLKKFAIDSPIQNETPEVTTPGSIAITCNGLEIINYKSEDKIYYGPLETVAVLNGGSDYDVINPPMIRVSPSSSSSSGNIAKIQPVVRGSIKKVYVKPQEFDVDTIISIEVNGGNGSGASLFPVLKKRRREIEFDARPSSEGGGLDIINDSISFAKNHNLVDGQEIIYSSNNNKQIGIGPYQGVNLSTGITLLNNSVYYAEVLNNISIKLYQSFSDYSSGINTVGFTTENASGIHKFKTQIKNELSEILVQDGGKGYENRKLIVNPTGISTFNNTINFTNHGFNEGDLIIYDYEQSPISGLSTDLYYKVIKISDDSFRLSNAGVGGTITSEYERKNYVKFNSTGIGYQFFNYPKIIAKVNFTTAGIGTFSNNTIELVPIVRGSIVDALLYEEGTDYGSTILNFHKKPSVNIVSGSEAKIDIFISNGSIVNVNLLYGGTNYFSTPELIVIGDGIGAELIPIISNNKIVDVIISNGGSNYSQQNTTVIVKNTGKNAILDPIVRSLSLNEVYRFGDESISESKNNLKYGVYGYENKLRNQFNDDNQFIHSPIIGWSYDGNPIYGSFGYSNPNDINSPIKLLDSAYVIDQNNISNRPDTSLFPYGFFVEDYKFIGSLDLDENNGRYTRTPEFPNGVYAYFASSRIDNSGNLLSRFPYFIGNTYRSHTISENRFLSQDFNFTISNLVRNTFPYKVAEKNAGNDFIIESNEFLEQNIIVESIKKGPISDLKIINPGNDYKVNDSLIFDNEGTGGDGIISKVSEVRGKDIIDIKTEVQEYKNSILTWNNENEINITILPSHDLNNLDNVSIIGLSTITNSRQENYTVDVERYNSSITQIFPPSPTVGFVTDIYISSIPDSVSVGSSISIQNETLKILNIYKSSNVLRVVREYAGVGYTESTQFTFNPNSFKIKIPKTDYFESFVNDEIYFNPLQSLGIGTMSGEFIEVDYRIGDLFKTISIPSQSIFIPDHPFLTGQEVLFNIPDTISSKILVFDERINNSYQIPSIGNTQKLYVIKKSKDYIGLTTNIGFTTFTDGLYFLGFIPNESPKDYQYSLESNKVQVKTKVERIKATVSVSTDHQLDYYDVISLNLNPSLNVGIGNSNNVKIKFDEEKQRLIVNPIGFNSTSINIIDSEINIPFHNLKTGDKIVYKSYDLIPSGISNDFYYIYKVDDDRIKLCETFLDCFSNPPLTVSIGSTGGINQEISPINPNLTVIRNNNLVFDLTDSSLIGYNFKIFYDKNFNTEFVSTGATDTFSTSGIGTVGISENASFTLNYSDDIPNVLYYSIEKSGSIVSSDIDVLNHSRINYTDSVYNGEYYVYGIGNTSFQISLNKRPERISYKFEDCDSIFYKTNSLRAEGPVTKLRIISGGQNYESFPVFVGSNSKKGRGAYILPSSRTIGTIVESRISDIGFDYPSDNTLRPNAIISNLISLESSQFISDIKVLNGGKNYLNPPDIIVVDSSIGKKIDSGIINCTLSGTSILRVNIVEFPRGISESDITVRSVNNENGIFINSVESSSSGIVTCVLSTPTFGFSEDPFKPGDFVYVEGIEKIGNEGSGFNSEDYGFNFFKVVGYIPNSNPGILEFDISEYTNDPGVAKQKQNFLARVINEKNYPKFDVVQDFSTFFENEQLLVNFGSGYIAQDLYISSSSKNYIKVYGNYKLSVGETIFGTQSGSIGTIQNIIDKNGYFDVKYSSKQNIGWSNDIGTLNNDMQHLPDNDYYQNLSYSIKSPIEYEKFITPVNNLLHPSGLKNFGDTEILSSSDFKFDYAGSSNELLINDFINENRVDTINNLDFVIDIDTLDEKISNSIRFKNLKLTNYIECRTNRVIAIDDISPLFSNKNLDPSRTTNLIEIQPTDRYNRFLVQIRKTDGSEIEFLDIVILNDSKNLFTLEKSSISITEERIGNVSGYEDIEGNFYLRFEPFDPFSKDYEIKSVKNVISNSQPTIGKQSIGLIDLINVNNNVNSGITTSLFKFNSSEYSSIHSSIQIIDNLTNEMNYVEIYLNHDGIDSYISEYYFSSDDFNSNFIGFFDSSIINDIVSLNYTNTSDNRITILSKNIGFGSTSLGISTYRFIEFGQIPGNERTVKYDANFIKSSNKTNIIALDSSIFTSLKSTIRVGYGNTSALHQVTLIQDGSNIHTLQYPFLSIGSTSGIGTFGGEYDNNNFILKFYPDSNINGEFEIISFSESFYTDLDLVNSPQTLSYGSVSESIFVSEFFALDGDKINRDNFEARYSGFPIYKKTFNPNNPNILNPSTGQFTIVNHFFSNLEEIIYKPKSTFIGIGEKPLGIGLTADHLGIVTNILPSKVYVIKDTNNQFRLSTRKDYAQAGIFVTFTSLGEGNAHELEMSKKVEKSIISIDNIVQNPIVYSRLSFKLLENNGEIGSSSTIFQLSGISSIRTGDFIKINDEYMKVTNVGLGTTNVGPITSIGSNTLVEVLRGSVGTAATSHEDLSDADIHRGSINIVGNRIYFADPPLGGADEEKYSEYNLDAPRSSFNGRVFLRQDYSSNSLYDDISNEFTGLDETFTLTSNGNNIVGLGSTGGNGLVFLNNIFQTPSTQNNLGNNYSIEEDLSVGITSIVFTGITSENGSLVISDFDINQNQLPRGGLIVSLGSTPGAGFAPLVGASISPILNGSGSIVGIGTESNFGSGYYGSVSIGITDLSGNGASITASVGAGGTLIFNISNGGNGYTDPHFEIPDPSYTNLPVIGVSRLGLGSTTETGKGLLLNVEVGAISTTGIGSTLFQVSSFKITRPGYGFRKGDVIKPVGLVTALGLESIIDDFEITILETFTDSFSSWQLGELDYIDSIKNLQDGKRTRFPLIYEGNLLSFELNRDDPDSQVIDFDALLIIFINGILQNPKESYQFTGGSSFQFSNPPKITDKIDVFFYNGTRGLDTLQISVKETVKPGDTIQIFKNNKKLDLTKSQTKRTIYDISASDLIKTNLYSGVGIDENNEKPLNWSKQKIDKIIDGQIVYKSRDSIESTIYPTSKVIKDFTINDSEIFLDNSEFFNYENADIINFGGLIISGELDPISAKIEPIVSSAGTIQNLTILDGGSGYIGTSIDVKISNPFIMEDNSEVKAEVVANISDGSITSVNIINPGFGYRQSSPPQVLISPPPVNYDLIIFANNIKGFSGYIVEVSTTTGKLGNPLALEFTLQFDPSEVFSDLLIGYPIYIFNTKSGNGIISINNDDSDIVGIGTTFLDNVYYIHDINQIGIDRGKIVCNISSNTNVLGIQTSGPFVGNFSWGKISGFNRSSQPKSFIVSGNTVDSDLSSFPTMQRRNFGLRSTGALKKEL
jgi:hypothetical protein